MSPVETTEHTVRACVIALYARWTTSSRAFKVISFAVVTTISFPVEHGIWERIGPMHQLAIYLGLMPSE